MRPMDRIDSQIVTHLQKNGRISNKELAAAVGLAASTCLMRVRRLHEDGVLLGVTAEVDPEHLGIGVQAMVSVQLARHSLPHVEAFRRHLDDLPEAVSWWHVTGTADFLVHVMVRDLEMLRDLALSAFTTRDEVARIETSIIYDHHHHRVLPNYAVEDGEG